VGPGEGLSSHLVPKSLQQNAKLKKNRSPYRYEHHFRVSASLTNHSGGCEGQQNEYEQKLKDERQPHVGGCAQIGVPCNSKQLLFSDSTEFWKVQEQQTYECL